MKILIMGAGALGSGIGGMLAKDKENQVIFIGRAKHMRAIKEKSLKISGVWGSHRVKNIITKTSAKNLPTQDIIIFTVKSTDTKKTAKEVKHLAGANTIIVSLQNGAGNEEILANIFGAEKVLGAMVMIGFILVKPGHVNVTVFGQPIKIGEMTHKITKRSQNIALLFKQANIPTDAVNNIRQFIWTKVLFNACLNPLGAILNASYGDMRNKNSWQIIQQIIKETFAVLKKEKIKLDWKKPEEYDKYLRNTLMPKVKDHKSSMLYDIEQEKITEIDFMNGKILELGKKYNIETPVNEAIYNMIKFKEKLIK